MPLIEQAEIIVDEVKRSDWRGHRTAFCLRLAPAARRYLEQASRARGVSMTDLINEAIAEHALVRTK